jgi:hypothetical protein
MSTAIVPYTPPPPSKPTNLYWDLRKQKQAQRAAGFYAHLCESKNVNCHIPLFASSKNNGK